jgi:hypothetical protein
MTDKTAGDLIERFNQLVVERSPYERDWQQIAAYIRPVRTEFRSIYFDGQLPAQSEPLVTDSTAMVALENFTGGIFGFLSNEANRWLDFRTFDDELNQYQPAKSWLMKATRIVLNSYGPAVSPFYTQVAELYGDTPGFGTGCFFSEYRGEGKFHDACYSPFDVYFDNNDYNENDCVYRPFWFTYRQAAQKFGVENLPDRVKKGETDPTMRFQFLHVVFPNDGYMPGQWGIGRFPFADVYVGVDDKAFVKKGGRYEQGYQTPRWAGTGKYGYGLGRRNLPDAKTINMMDVSVLEAAEWQNHPAILMPDRNSLSTRPAPRKALYGGLGPGGREAAKFMQPTGNLPITFEITNARREQLRDAFFFSLMQLIGRTGMTATEIMSRDEEKMRLMGPHLARIQREFLSPNVTQRFSMLWRQGFLPPPPPELQGQQLKIEFVSPMAKAQKSALATGAIRLVDQTLALAQIRPDAADKLNVDRIVDTWQDAFGAPADTIFSDDEVKQKREQKQKIAALQTGLDMGQQGAGIVKQLTEVQRNQGRAA